MSEDAGPVMSIAPLPHLVGVVTPSNRDIRDAESHALGVRACLRTDACVRTVLRIGDHEIGRPAAGRSGLPAVIL